MTGPRPPPYIGKNIYKPGIRVHGLVVRAFSKVKAPKGFKAMPKLREGRYPPW